MTKESIARVCHEANRALCIGIGDNSQPRWDDASNKARASSLAGVEYRLDNPAASAIAQHDQWMEDRLAAGWAYAEVTDKPNKRHACLVPYGDLPIEQRAKDALFIAVVTTLAPLLPVPLAAIHGPDPEPHNLQR